MKISGTFLWRAVLSDPHKPFNYELCCILSLRVYATLDVRQNQIQLNMLWIIRKNVATKFQD